MKYREISAEDMSSSVWSGGTTTEIAIYPEKAKYAERDFVWRISTAKVELHESDFTPLPDYERLIASIDGVMLLSHEKNGGCARSGSNAAPSGKGTVESHAEQDSCAVYGSENASEVRLDPISTVYRFDGGAKTHCVGRAKDLNLMLRKGRAEGKMEFVRQGETKKLSLAPNETAVIYSISGKWARSYENNDSVDEEVLFFAENGNYALFRISVVPN